MKNEKQNNLITIVSGGAAGDGARSVGGNLARLLVKEGFEVFESVDYPSIIRGGHNFARLSFSNQRVYNDHSLINILIAFNQETIQLHRDKFTSETIILANDFTGEEISEFGARAIKLPMEIYANKENAPMIASGSVALGAVCFLLNLSFEKLEEALNDVFQEKHLAVNVVLAKQGYQYLKEKQIIYPRNFESIQPIQQNKEVLNASETFGQGMVQAGLDYYVAYPMTPASPILHFLAKQNVSLGIKIVQPESELSVINMALGIAYTGKRVAIGTSGGGFALMQESFSFAGMGEIPLLIAMVQRPAPASGVPTYTSQADLLFILNSGHGEFPRIVIAPGDAEEAFQAGADGLNLAWKYQLPVIVLTDKHIGESAQSGQINKNKTNINIEKGKIVFEANTDYKRYEITDDGISPMIFPGVSDIIVKVNSYEHNEKGVTTENAKDVVVMQDKRFAKLVEIKKEFEIRDTVKIYGDVTSKTVVVFWGSTKGAVLEAAKYLAQSVKFLQIVWLEPFDVEAVLFHLQDADMIIDIEGNHDGQLAKLIRQKTGIDIKQKILKYDTRPFDPFELAKEIIILLESVK